ncbi:hypothetical protein R1sor_015556 [Riccia sorocarpa]|uniref:Uncharacterized protein n=1 Tax=Riccia sorocarpa TaxID=122646 RepID=A0ABD3HFK7_9MARC
MKKHLNKRFVSWKDYKEVLYYREATPYGSSYYLMTLVLDASDGSDPEGKPAPKQQKPDTPDLKVRFTKKVGASTSGPATPLSTSIRSLDDLAAAMGQDVKRVVEKHCSALLSRLGTEGLDLQSHIHAVMRASTTLSGIWQITRLPLRALHWLNRASKDYKTTADDFGVGKEEHVLGY